FCDSALTGGEFTEMTAMLPSAFRSITSLIAAMGTLHLTFFGKSQRRTAPPLSRGRNLGQGLGKRKPGFSNRAHAETAIAGKNDRREKTGRKREKEDGREAHTLRVPPVRSGLRARKVVPQPLCWTAR